MWLWNFVLYCVVVLCAADTTTKLYPIDPKEEIITRVVRDCTKRNDRFICFSEKAAIAIERSINWDIPLFEGVTLIRNEEKINILQGRSLSGFSRLLTAISNFVNTHSFSVDFADNRGATSRKSRDGGLGGGGGGGGGDLLGINKQDLKKEKKYMQYAFMVLLGIFGLTGPLVMKTLAIMAAKALLAAKAALIIVGSVALKKIFESDHHEKGPSVKVHTIPSYEHHDEEHDRISYNQIPYYSYTPFSTYTPFPVYNTPYPKTNIL